VTFGSLFAGIGGMDLGFERAGLTCKWQVEIDPHARRVLAKHWPDVRRHDDVRTFPPDDGADWSVDVVAGGFPCQDISFAGKGAGLAGERSGLWYEFARVVRVLRPRYVVVENVAALLVRGLDAVLGTLASLGYDAEWEILPAAAFGAPHIRNRVFLVAHAASIGREPWTGREGSAGERRAESGPRGEVLSDTECPGRNSSRPNQEQARTTGRIVDGRDSWTSGGGHQEAWSDLPDADRKRLAIGPCFGGDALAELKATQRSHSEIGGHWGFDPADDPESGMGRVAHGIPARVDRLRGLGNAVVPAVAQFIAERINECLYASAP